jgi:hypothetical protein
LWCVTGVFIIIKAVKSKTINLIPFGLSLISLGLASIPELFGSYSGAAIFRGIGLILVLLFIKKTFYEEKKSPFVLFVICLIIGASFMAIFDLWSKVTPSKLLEYIRDLSFAISIMIPFCWLTIASYSSYKRVKTLEIEPHIKKRYQILGVVAFINLIPATFLSVEIPLAITVMPDFSDIVLIGFLVSSLLTIVFYYILWFMPASVKNYFNKDYTPKVIEEDVEISEEELMKSIREDIGI